MKQKTAEHFVCRHSLLQREIPGMKMRQPMSNKSWPLKYIKMKKALFNCICLFLVHLMAFTMNGYTPSTKREEVKHSYTADLKKVHKACPWHKCTRPFQYFCLFCIFENENNLKTVYWKDSSPPKKNHNLLTLMSLKKTFCFPWKPTQPKLWRF